MLGDLNDYDWDGTVVMTRDYCSLLGGAVSASVAALLRVLGEAWVGAEWLEHGAGLLWKAI